MRSALTTTAARTPAFAAAGGDRSLRPFANQTGYQSIYRAISRQEVQLTQRRHCRPSRPIAVRGQYCEPSAELKSP